VNPIIKQIDLAHEFEELERLLTGGKHGGEPVKPLDPSHHFRKADQHMTSAGPGLDEVDWDSGALHLINAASRLLLAAHCIRKGSR
jgi:hypothetical protein